MSIRITKSLDSMIGIFALFITLFSGASWAGEPPTQGLGISLKPASIVSAPGQGFAVDVMLSRTNNESPIVFEATGAPPGTWINFSVNPMAAADQKSVMNVKLPRGMSLGSYPVIISASDGSTSVTQELILMVGEQ